MDHQLIDLETIQEFMKETLAKVEKDALVKIAKELELKHGFFIEMLDGKASQMSEQDLENLLNQIFATRKRRKKIMELYPLDQWRSGIAQLLDHSMDLQTRFNDFCRKFDQIDKNIRIDLASEILHFTYPGKYWLWCRWIWDEKLNTGALPLVVTENFELRGKSPGESYMKVGKGIAFVHSVAEMGGFKYIHSSLFGTDVFLSCVYVIYAYTILRMRMTQEFNNVMPSLIEFSRRLLGVYNIPTAA